MPRMHRSEDLSKSEKKSLQRIQLIILEYGVSFLTDTSDAILLNTILASLPIPPVEENTKGENEPHVLVTELIFFCSCLNLYFIRYLYIALHRSRLLIMIICPKCNDVMCRLCIGIVISPHQ